MLRMTMKYYTIMIWGGGCLVVIWIQCLLCIHSVQQRSTACCCMAGSQCSHSQQRHNYTYIPVHILMFHGPSLAVIQYSIDTITLVFPCRNSTSTQSWSVWCHLHSVAHAYSERWLSQWIALTAQSCTKAQTQDACTHWLNSGPHCAPTHRVL